MRTRAKAHTQPSGSPQAQSPPERHQTPRPSVDGHIQSPSDDFVPSTSPSQSPPPHPATPEASDHASDDEFSNPNELNVTQSQNARSARWLPWQDRLLIQEVEKHRPFNAARGDATKEAWATLAVELLKDSTIDSTPINRTGPSCRARFQKLLKAHSADETRSLQKTGTDEEVDSHLELLTQVSELVRARELEKDEKSATARKKADVEAQAALQLRDSAMKGLVRREALTDVATLDGASVREKQGQRKRRRSAEGAFEPEKENDEIVQPKSKRRRNQLTDIVKSRNASDAKRLDQARKLDEQRHAESMVLQQRSLILQENMVAGFGQLSQGLAVLAGAQAKLMEMEARRAEADTHMRTEDSERRRVDAERRAAEAERHASLLAALSASRNHN
ncbi:hypothetical protein DFH09DRAFT_353512 [Mycena vulgaris]|nr:hypothetical protein DFH09DRAFT_353512 [Mycena vulgaris]